MQQATLFVAFLIYKTSIGILNNKTRYEKIKYVNRIKIDFFIHKILQNNQKKVIIV